MRLDESDRVVATMVLLPDDKLELALQELQVETAEVA